MNTNVIVCCHSWRSMNILAHIANFRDAVNCTSVFYSTNQIVEVMEYKVDNVLSNTGTQKYPWLH